MRFMLALLYAALLFGANTAFAQDLSDLREGDMKKLVLHSAPKAVSAQPFYDTEGGEHALADYQGKVVLLNFWATWCAPCRAEMPALEALSSDLEGDDFAVVPIATGRNPVPAVRRFFEEIGVDSLPILLDPKSKLAREMGVFALPVTVILDQEGFEIARLMGDADWNSESARAIFAALIDPISGD